MQGKRIGTHDGAFHCDEVTGCMLLKNYTSEFNGCEIVRTRDKSVLDTLDIVIDVGGEYDHDRKRYDHHQRGFEEHYNEDFKIKLSASGLVYKHYGKEIIKNALEELFQTEQIKNKDLKALLNEVAYDKLTLDLYEKFFITIDAIDNGIDQYPKDVKPNYRFYSTHLAARVGRMNPFFWDSEDVVPDQRFVEAMKIAREDFLADLLGSFMSSFASFPIVREAFDNRFKCHESGEIISLSKGCWWKEALFDLEKSENVEGLIKFVIYESGDDYRSQAVPKALGTFENRGGLRSEWRGKTSEQIAE